MFRVAHAYFFQMSHEFNFKTENKISIYGVKL